MVWCGVVWCFFSARRSCSTVREKPRTRERRRQAYGFVQLVRPPGPRAGGGHRTCQPRPVRRASGTGRGGATPCRVLAAGAFAAVSALALLWRGLLQVLPSTPPAGRASRLGRTLPAPAGEELINADLACAPRLLEGRVSTLPASARGLAVGALTGRSLQTVTGHVAWMATSRVATAGVLVFMVRFCGFPRLLVFASPAEPVRVLRSFSWLGVGDLRSLLLGSRPAPFLCCLPLLLRASLP